MSVDVSSSFVPAQRREEFGAGLLTPPAGFSAHLAVAVHGSMLPAFIGANLAGGPASNQHCTGDFGVVTAVAGEDLSGRRADVYAVKVGADARSELGDHIFTQTGVGARGASLGAVEARLDAFDELSLIDAAQILGVGVQHGLYICHWILFPCLNSRS
jgi:hypothetical protein